MARTTVRVTLMRYTETMKYYIVKMVHGGRWADCIIVNEADNVVDARAMVEELDAERSFDERVNYGILPSIMHSRMHQEQEENNVL